MVRNRCVAQTIIVIAASYLLNASNVSLAAEKAEEGFASLFNGKTLDGWHLMNGAKFVAEDRVIKLNGGRGWLRSDKEYADLNSSPGIPFHETQPGRRGIPAIQQGR